MTTETKKRYFEIGQPVRWRKKIGPGKFFPWEEGKIIDIKDQYYVCRTAKGQTWPKIWPQQEGGNDILELLNP